VTPPAPSLISLFVSPLNRLGVEYMVTGGLASVIYGQPRMTLDIDLVLRLPERTAERFSECWPPSDFYTPPLEVLLAEGARPQHGHFNISHHDSTLRADVYVAGEDPLNAWALRRVVIRTIDGVDVRVAPIEAVILGKLRYYRMGGSDRHLRDIHQMVRVSGDSIDRPALDAWVGRLGLQAEWDRALTYTEPV
jgi:hypothetical protein